MSQAQTTTIKVMYSGTLEYITLPMDAKYEDFLKVATERFAIPEEFQNSLQISNHSRQIFKKDTFEYFTTLFPNPEEIFYIRMDYRALLGALRSTHKRKPFAKINKRKRSDKDETYVAVPVTRHNCFIGYFPGLDASDSEEEPLPQAKKAKTDQKPKEINSKTTETRRISSRKSIRC